MLKVECESCKAPYQIDERRVPPTGLKMRCPKCGHSFLVTNPGAPAPAAAAPAAPPRPAPPAAPAAKPPPPVPAAKPAPAPPPAPAPAAKPPAVPKRTILGVAAPAPPAAPKPAPPPAPPIPPARAPLPSDFPAALGALDEPDLPVISVGLPAALAVSPPSPSPPSPPPPAARLPSPPPARRVPGGDIELDLPSLQSDLPALADPHGADLPDLASDLPALASDLPAIAANLPAARPARGGSPRMAGGSFELDLPSAAAAGLPVAKHGGGGLDLPAVADTGLPAIASAAGLPVVSASLPAVSAGLPVVSAGLPSPAAALPSPAGNLPSPANILPSPANILPSPANILPVAHAGFGEIDIPSLNEPAPAPRQVPSLGGSFGEIELPREGAALGSPPPPRAARTPGASSPPPAGNTPDFGDLELGGASAGGASNAPPTAGRGSAAGGMTFGELDFGGEDASASAAPPSIGVDSSVSPPKSLPPAGPDVKAAATAPVSIRPAAPRGEREPAEPRKRSRRGPIAAAVLVVAILGGAALQLTPYGVFGYLVIGDKMHEKAYAATTDATLAAAHKTLASDTYDDAKAAVEATAAAHAGNPRIKALSSVAAIVDYATTVRFGPDAARASRAKQLVADLSATPDVKYLDVALAAQSAEAGDFDKGRKALDGVARRYPGDPILADVALLRGNLELSAKDAAAAVVAFKQAASLASDARAHYGLARGYDLLGDATNAKKEIDATLSLSPLHPGALTLRARRQSASVDDASALKDLTTVLDGPARGKASPSELSNAYAARAWVSLERGAASDAGDAFAQAVKLDPRNVAALNGEGRLLLAEGRNTEAMSRFDTALQFDPNSPETIANDAEAKLSLERLADAKQQLVDASKRFPKSIPILLLLGKAEQHLGNNDAAEQDLRTAVSFTDPARPDAVLPYVALSELLSARGHLADAKTVLDDARKRLPPSAALDRAVGEVNEAQGDYDLAITQYKASLAKDPKDVATHFRLAVVLRRIRKFDDAGAELDSVAAVDKDYPGLSLERGLLFEESGDVEKAIELFKAALAKAPDDPDLQLRVGSAYVAIGRPDDALPMLMRVLTKRPNSAEANHYIGRAKMLGGPGDQVEALRFLQHAVELDPNRAEYHVYLAWAANDAPNPKLDLARDEVDKALALDKQNPEAYWQKGVLERMQGAVDDAIKDERHALLLRPSRYEAHATLAECYEDKNDDATALGEWARAVAGDDASKSPDGAVAHPFWRYRYGKLLLLHGQSGAALAQLLPAVVSAEKDTGPKPGWLMLLEFQTAEALRQSGRRSDAVEHYRRFLELAPVSSPDRVDAQKYVKQLSGGN